MFRDFIAGEWRWLLLYIMLGTIMYWTAIVIEPTNRILQQQNIVLEQQANQTKEIIANQNKTSQDLIQVINWIEENREEQVYYLLTIINQSNSIGNQTADLILESIDEVEKLNQNISSDLNTLAEQHMIITKDLKQTQNQTGQISGFLGGPVVLNGSMPQELLGKANVTFSNNPNPEPNQINQTQ